jgi:hypothetical protein
MNARDIARLRNARSCSACGFDRMEALVAVDPILCAVCHANARGVSTIERHHIAGRANHRFTIPVDANTHRILSAAQRAWPVRTLRNPERSESVQRAALCRGLADILVFIASELEAC